MNAQADRPDHATGPAGDQPDEAQMRAAYEAELSRITSVDMVLQAAASLLNIGAHRLGLIGVGSEQRAGADRQGELEQVRDAIDAVRGLMPVVERRAATELRPLRDALAQLQMAYSRAIQELPGQDPDQTQGGGATAPEGEPGEKPGGESQPAEGAPAPGAQDPGAQDSGAGGRAGQAGQSQPRQGRQPGPAESSGRLWVPGR